MKKIFLFLFLFLINTTYGMFRFRVPDEQKSNPGPETQMQNYSCLQMTARYDDTQQNVNIPEPLFVGLCVQARNMQHYNKQPFQELVQKIKNKTIKTSKESSDLFSADFPPYVKMTKKDAHHRLLSYIECDEYKNVSINGRDIKLIEYCCTANQLDITSNVDPKQLASPNIRAEYNRLIAVTTLKK